MSVKIIYGKYTFEGGEIFNGHYGQATSLSISVLSLDTFRATVLCDDPTIQDFAPDIPLEYYRDEIKRAVYYVDAITRIGPQKYTISALSPLARLAQQTHYGGIYTGQPVEDVVAEICGDIPCIIKTNLLGTKIYNWLPIANSRSNLQQVLLILGANLWTDHNGVLRISNLWDGLTSVLDEGRVYASRANARRDKPVTSVTVLEHQYIPGTERKELANGTFVMGQRIPFDGPMSDLRAEGVSILESGANYAVVSAGSGTITGCPYTHTTLEITRKVTDAPIKNEVRIDDATLVSLVNSNAVADRLVKYYACRDTIQVDAVLRQEHPGEVVQIIHPYDRTMVYACLAASEVELSATLKGSLTALVGFAPEQVEDSDYYDERIVLTGAGIFIPPEGAETARYVIIGGAQGGYAGHKGEPGSVANVSFSDGTLVPAHWSGYGPGPGGPGGLGGKPGLGGRILTGTIDLTELEQIAYQCGVGGDGAEYNADDPDAAPADGTDTIFGTLTSADGERSETGYVDIMTGEVYGAPGLDGIPGGAGAGKTDRATDGNNVAEFDAAGSVMAEDGTVYQGGKTTELEPGLLNVRAAVATCRTDGNLAMGYGAGSSTVSLGSGAAAGAAGVDGSAERGEFGATADPPVSGMRAVTAWGYALPGIQGASATLTPRKAVNGNGGRGGYGGGGGSSIGYGMAGRGGSGGSVTLRTRTALPGPGGDGSAGGPGSDGLIILYVRRKREKRGHGALVTAKHNFFADKSGRLFIV